LLTDHLFILSYVYRLVVFRSTAGVTNAQLEEAATQMEKYATQRFVHALVRT